MISIVSLFPRTMHLLVTVRFMELVEANAQTELQLTAHSGAYSMCLVFNVNMVYVSQYFHSHVYYICDWIYKNRSKSHIW